MQAISVFDNTLCMITRHRNITKYGSWNVNFYVIFINFPQYQD